MTTNKIQDDDDYSSASFSDGASWESGCSAGESDGGDSKTFAKDESRSVTFVRMFVITMLLVAAAALSSVTFMLLRKREVEDFESAFDEYSTKVLDIAEERIQRQAVAAEFFATTISSYAEISGQEWPFISVPDMNATSLYLANAISILFSPLVLDSQAADWEIFGGRAIVGTRPNDEDHTMIDAYMPLYQAIPTNHSFLTGVTLDLLHYPGISEGLKEMLKTEAPILMDFNVTDSYHWQEIFSATKDSNVSLLLHPVFNGTEVVGAISLQIDWRRYFEKIMSPEENGPLRIVVSSSPSSSCSNFSLQLDGYKVQSLGAGDCHELRFGENNLESPVPIDGNKCHYKITVWPTAQMEDSFITRFPIIATSIVSLVFLFALALFCSYDKLVSNKQKAVLIKAKQSNAIISSLFPAGVRDRLMEEAKSGELKHSLTRQTDSSSLVNTSEDDVDPVSAHSKPRDDLVMSTHMPKVIADRYPECTVFFLDLVGFTAWSSQRPAEHVFLLLESIFASFDKAARRRGVYKVETIGDCYLAVSGIPEPREDHALVCAKFALECRNVLSRVLRRLSKKLGPDTEELKSRIGLHSGPVTAGVLRGERGRFQLFGDTVNTASRMESTGEPNKIQISESVEALLRTNKTIKVEPRGMVSAKGKGSLQTFWLMSSPSATKSMTASSMSSCTSLISEEEDEQPIPILPVAPINPSRALKNHVMADMHKTTRLVDWIVELLASQLNQVIANREERQQANEPLYNCYGSHSLLDEVEEIIRFPEFDSSKIASSKEGGLSMEACIQLREFVSLISCMYRDSNPFHNFVHAGKVLLAMAKFLSISCMSNFDPLTKFSCLFAALVHDLDHKGKSNQQLIHEGAYIAEVYNQVSVAEQNSLDLALSTLLQERFADLRACIFPTGPEFELFRQVVVNLVLATDIFGPLSQMRREKWNKAFSKNLDPNRENSEEMINRKKTCALELLMQASDVAHTMQYFDVYSKWNSHLFAEMYAAYQNGSAQKDPATFWYKGEISFFDSYVIPLAKQLQESGFFGHAADEAMNYALENRREWVERGEELVARFLEDCQRDEKEISQE